MSEEQQSIGRWMGVRDVVPWAGNPRVHPASSVTEVAASIKRFGFVAPVCVWTSRNEVVAGHNRIKAMLSLIKADKGFAAKGSPGAGLIPVRFHEFESEEEAHAYAVADNKLNELSGWSQRDLDEVFKELRDNNLSTEGIGFSQDELDEVFKRLGDAVNADGGEGSGGGDGGGDGGTDGGEGGDDGAQPPGEFPQFGDDIKTDYCCPKCGYEWSGKPK